ncbi:MAG: pyruvate kinase alpha/beta domain-containing protein [Armatimonadota bacterium]
MPVVPVNYFENPGPENTEATLQAAQRRAADLSIDQVVVATTSGRTALQAAKTMPDAKIIGVTLHAGLWETYAAPDDEIIAEAEEKGVTIVTASHTFLGSIASAVFSENGGMPPAELMGRTYYTISQGTKVAVECMIMAADAGHLDMEEDVISIAGTNSGADTAIVVKPVFSNDFFNCRVREFLCMPRRDAEE